MKLYLAAINTNGYKHTNRYNNLNQFEKQIVHSFPNLLESYHYIHKQSFIDAIRKLGDKVFLDSGAFSAFNVGVEISMEKYCDYILQNEDIIRRDDGVLMASVLDGIGDPQKTLENQQVMEKMGVKPLPCFHYGEDERYLEYYIKNYEYITIGGLVPISTLQCEKWLDRIWEKHLTDGSGKPRLKVHGFGMTSVDLMRKYPWYSVDSSTWIQAASFGGIFMPDYGPVRVSDKSPERHKMGQHISNFSEIERQSLLKMIADEGYDIERLTHHYEARAVYSAHGFHRIGEQIDKEHSAINYNFNDDQMDLFG